MIYLTGDEHYNHKNIIKYAERPFSSVEEMNEIIIRNHNTIVNNEDYVYHVGDFYFSSKHLTLKDLMFRLNGQHILIRGNHDRYGKKKYMDAGFLDVKKIMYINKIKIVHKPIKHNPNWHICGHVHNKFIIDNHSINVGVDKWGFIPVSLDIIKMSITAKESELKKVNKMEIKNHV